MEWFKWLLSNSGYMPRAICGVWTPGMIALHNISDFLIWTAYVAIPIVLVKFAYSKRRELPFRRLFWLFGLFILACGTTHFMDIVMFYNPLYHLAGIIKLVTALASWGTVVALVYVIPVAIRMRSPEELEREIVQRELAEAELQRAHDNLEKMVQSRNADLQMLEATQQKLEDALAHVKAQSLTDMLTGVNNRRALNEKLAHEFSLSQRHNSPFSVLMIDVDQFKAFNDNFGHIEGDGLLQCVAGVLKDQARTTDFVARYGGEEFIVLLPHTDSEGALALAEKLREAVQGIPEQKNPVTVSIGTSTLKSSMQSGKDLVEAADKALYLAKQNGRNRVEQAN
jgi:diguanylate cyclase (GGDEF)-like protein